MPQKSCHDRQIEAHKVTSKRPSQGRSRKLEKEKLIKKLTPAFDIDSQNLQSCSDDFTDLKV